MHDQPTIVLFNCHLSAAFLLRLAARVPRWKLEDIYPSILYAKASSLLAIRVVKAFLGDLSPQEPPLSEAVRLSTL
jgi:hypothetical protein